MEFILYLIIFCFGLCMGSFLNVLIDRLPAGESAVKGRSHCDHCKTTLNWHELIPLLSFLIQGGKSRCCHKKLSFQYPLIELITGIGFVWLYQTSLINTSNHWSYILLMNLVIFSCLLVIFITDLKTFIIPDSMIAISISATIARLLFSQDIIFILPNICSALGASLFFYFLYIGTRGRGMGFGDVKLALLLGLMTGFPGIIINLYVAFLTGAILGVILILYRQKSFKSQVPFGPFLIVGTLVTVLWQAQIISWWKGVL
jgi:leader peptidase (prepilin peptidase) / N-methyltransferase